MATTQAELLQAHNNYLLNLRLLIREDGNYVLVRTIGAWIHYAMVRWWGGYGV